ncbi:unnamed protein product [Somion occarium]|uniref:Tetrapyrrole biosynthesis uroporphyrinogen III synthase domain-containing protein n=1 Tax=Somion occarium TaxID=3059160 RepID=A0ABP1E1D6_9APHY
MANVLLLRAASQDAPDKYEAAFRAQGYHPVSIPVLETCPVNTSELRRIISRGPVSERLSGVILTSARAVEVWKDVIEDLVRDGEDPGDADWSRTPFYVVGEATATTLLDVSDAFPGSPYAPRNICGGAQSGTSEKLAHHILHHHPLEGPRPTFLYLTGDKNRDTLPSILNAGGVDLKPLQVYETRGSSTFAHDLRTTLEGLPLASNQWWIVHFAPSSANFVTPMIREHFTLPSIDSADQGAGNLRVDAVASKPSPEALLDAIQKA